MKFEIIEDKEQLYDKCENMEELYDNYYYNLLVNYQELKKLLEKAGQSNVVKHKYASKCEDKVITMEAQQKEFIKYLKQKEINIKYLIGSYGTNTDYLRGKKDVIIDILEKYKEIIGSDK